MKKINLVVNKLSNFQLTESIKTLRTNVIFTGQDTKAIGITSFNKNDGKSIISFSLALSLAENGKKTIIVEADLKAGVLQHTLQIREKVEGLSHYLSGINELDDVIYNTNIQNLDIMFSGTRVINSSELLGTEKFEELIKLLKQKYDYIILDGAPLGQVVDSAVVAPKIDGVLLVIDVTNNSYKLVNKIKEQLEYTGAKILGVVLNKVNFKERKGYYGHRYSYYGYGHAKEKLQSK